MKTLNLKSIIPFLILTTLLISCTKDSPKTESTPIVEAGSLSYAEGGGSILSVTNPFASATSTTIFGNNASTSVVEIKLTSLAVATYTVGGGNEFKYTRVGTTSPWNAVSGTITVTENTANKVSGNFNLTAGNSSLGINSVAGKFTNIVINP